MFNADIAIPAASAQTADSLGTLTADAKQLAANIVREMAAGNDAILTEAALGELFGALCKLYSANAEQQGHITPIRTGEDANATAVLMTTTALLRGAKLELFELGMWQSWSGMK
jgi:hypothetical protein